MTLKKATFWVIWAFIYIFTIRTVGTIVPTLFTNLLLVKINVVFILLSRIAVLNFFIAFFRKYADSDKRKTRFATSCAITASIASLVLTIMDGSRLFGLPFFPDNTWIQDSNVIVPVLAALVTLLFFIFFYLEVARFAGEAMKTATRLAIAGSAIFSLTLCIGLFHYMKLLKSAESVLESTPKVLIVIGIPAILIGFFCTINFLVNLYKNEKNLSGNPNV